MRNDPTRKFTACRDDDARKILNDRARMPHQVRFDHGDCGDAYALIDEQYFFEDAEDARWFYREGHRRMLYEGEERPERLVLWVDDVQQAWQNQRARDGARTHQWQRLQAGLDRNSESTGY
jgi:hypothetical protein